MAERQAKIMALKEKRARRKKKLEKKKKGEIVNMDDSDDDEENQVVSLRPESPKLDPRHRCLDSNSCRQGNEVASLQPPQRPRS